jgi:superfamily II DNA or RNA helicase
LITQEPVLPPILSFERGTLILSGLSRSGLPPVLRNDPWQWDSRSLCWRCDAVHYSGALNRLTELGFEVRDTLGPFQAVRWGARNLPELWEHQAGALQAWMNQGSGLVVLPTGAGKTEVALAIMAKTAISTLVVAPVRDLMYQWHQRILRGLNYDAGIIGDNIYNLKPVSVTTYDSAYIHMDKLGGQFGLIVFDECHHLPGGARRDAAVMCAAPMRLGLTATPRRSDGRHADLEWLIGPTVYEMPLSRAKGDTLADYEVVRIPVYLEPGERARYDALSQKVRGFMYERRKDKPRYSWEDLCAETGKDPAARKAQKAYFAKQAIEDRAKEKLRVLEDIFRLHGGSRVIVFVGSNAMARDVSLRFLIPCIISQTKKHERRDILEGFANGVYPAIVANQVLDEGVDVPKAKIGVVLGGKSSGRQAIQRLGRLLRRQGGEKAVLYEIVCQETKEVARSRARRRSDAYQGTRHRRL